MGLLGLLRLDEDDPALAEARQDVAEFHGLIENLVKQRRALGRSQKEVAGAMGTSQSVVSDFERVTGNPRIDTLQRYARAVDARVAMHMVVTGKLSLSTSTGVTFEPIDDTGAVHLNWPNSASAHG